MKQARLPTGWRDTCDAMTQSLCGQPLPSTHTKNCTTNYLTTVPYMLTQTITHFLISRNVTSHTPVLPVKTTYYSNLIRTMGQAKGENPDVESN